MKLFVKEAYVQALSMIDSSRVSATVRGAFAGTGCL